MNFNSLKSLIADNKRQLEKVATSSTSTKYLKLSELEKEREKSYLLEQEELERKRKQKAEEKLSKLLHSHHGVDKLSNKPTLARNANSPTISSAIDTSSSKSTDSQEGDAGKLKDSGTDCYHDHEPSSNSTSLTAGEKKEQVEDSTSFPTIPKDELTKRLRAKGQPVRLFGESEKSRAIRLRNLEALEESLSERQGNEFMARLLKIETKLEQSNTSTPSTLPHLIGTLSADAEAAKKKKEEEEQNKLVKITADKTEAITKDLMKNDKEKVSHLIILFFRRLLREWDEYLSEKPDEFKRSSQGKMVMALQQQTSDYIKPLFFKLKHGVLPQDVLEHLVEICSLCQQREYVKANDVYLRLSIGNAPWPIGVTMVGIHERSAREKIFSNQVAHVLNDETQRKWIQSMKRLMTFCQQKYPPDDLAKAVG